MSVPNIYTPTPTPTPTSTPTQPAYIPQQPTYIPQNYNSIYAQKPQPLAADNWSTWTIIILVILALIAFSSVGTLVGKAMKKEFDSAYFSALLTIFISGGIAAWIYYYKVKNN